MTNHQISVHIKTVLAQLINSIFIPIIVNYFIKENIYAENGLIQDIFIFGIALALVYPLGKFINPAYLVRYFYARWKLWPTNKLGLKQY